MYRSNVSFLPECWESSFSETTVEQTCKWLRERVLRRNIVDKLSGAKDLRSGKDKRSDRTSSGVILIEGKVPEQRMQIRR